MSPMIDIQRRHADVFRIRLGDKDGNRPRKLTDRMRITARSSEIVQSFVDVYGGEVTPWEGQFQTYLPTTELRVLVLPGQSIQQWWEQYRGSVCQRRCDGYQEQKSGNRCMCPEDIYERAEDKNACSPMTRVNVLCPDVALLGAGSLVTHSMIAAETLPQSIAVAEMALARGLMVPAVLRVVLNDKGRNHFIYPQIEIIGMSMNSLAAGETMAALPHATKTSVADLEGASAPAIGAGNGQANPDLTPVPPTVQQRPARPVAEQAANVGQQPGTRRKNAAAPIPSTGLAPRTAAEAEAQTPAPPSADGGEDLEALSKAQLVLRCKRAGLPTSGNKPDLIERLQGGTSEAPGEARDEPPADPTPSGQGTPPQDDVPPPAEPGDKEQTDPQRKKFFATLREHGISEAQRKALLKGHYRVESLNDLSRQDLAGLLDSLEQEGGPQAFVEMADGYIAKRRVGDALGAMTSEHARYGEMWGRLAALVDEPGTADGGAWAEAAGDELGALIVELEALAKAAKEARR